MYSRMYDLFAAYDQNIILNTTCWMKNALTSQFIHISLKFAVTFTTYYYFINSYCEYNAELNEKVNHPYVKDIFSN